MILVHQRDSTDTISRDTIKRDETVKKTLSYKIVQNGLIATECEKGV